RPIIVTVSSILLLVFLGSSVATLNVSNLAVETLPSSSEQGELFNIIDDEYPALNEADIILTFTNSDIIDDYVDLIDDNKNFDSDSVLIKETEDLTTLSVNTINDD